MIYIYSCKDHRKSELETDVITDRKCDSCSKKLVIVSKFGKFIEAEVIEIAKFKKGQKTLGSAEKMGRKKASKEQEDLAAFNSPYDKMKAEMNAMTGGNS